MMLTGCSEAFVIWTVCLPVCFSKRVGCTRKDGHSVVEEINRSVVPPTAGDPSGCASAAGT